jgi:hypothetical protein
LKHSLEKILNLLKIFGDISMHVFKCFMTGIALFIKGEAQGGDYCKLRKYIWETCRSISNIMIYCTIILGIYWSSQNPEDNVLINAPLPACHFQIF